jgi:hypothetical protein
MPEWNPQPIGLAPRDTPQALLRFPKSIVVASLGAVVAWCEARASDKLSAVLGVQGFSLARHAFSWLLLASATIVIAIALLWIAEDVGIISSAMLRRSGMCLQSEQRAGHVCELAMEELLVKRRSRTFR